MGGTRARWDAVAERYDAYAADQVADHATAALMELTGEVAGLRVLDVACGQGRIARELTRRGARVVGIDIAAELLGRAHAREREEPLGIRYELVDAAGADALRGERFDAATCNQALADIDDLDGALDTVARVLTPGGWFAFSIVHPCFPGWPTADAPSSWPPGAGYFQEGWWLATNAGWRGAVGSNHRTLATYVNALADRGLGIERLTEIPYGPRWLELDPGRDEVPLFLAARCRRRWSR
jgi:SAM-dependent methyltransferase